MRFQIYTMYVNGPDLLNAALGSLGPHVDEVVAIDNSPDQRLTLPGFRGEIYRPDVPLFVSQSYNLIMDLAKERELDLLFMMHSDAIASAEIVDEMLDRARALTVNEEPWAVIMSNYDVLALFNLATISDLRWDQYLPISYTDVDYYYRLRLLGRGRQSGKRTDFKNV